MHVGDETYKKALRRYNTLLWLDAPTPRQQTELIDIDMQLTAAELQGRGLRAIVNDYDLTMAAGDLGGAEIG